jgi:hypothetical protein
MIVVQDVLDGVVVAAETDGRGPGRRRPLDLEFAGNAQVGVAAGVVAPAVVGGCVGKIERVVDLDAATPERFQQAHGGVVSARKRRLAMGGGVVRDRKRRLGMGGGGDDMGSEEDEEEDGEAW